MKFIHMLVGGAILAALSDLASFAQVRAYRTRDGRIVIPYNRSTPRNNVAIRTNAPPPAPIPPPRVNAHLLPPLRPPIPVRTVPRQTEAVPKITRDGSTNQVDSAETPSLEKPKPPKPIITGLASLSYSHEEDPIITYQKRDAAKGFPEAEFALGMRYLNGLGVPQNETKGRDLIESAASHGSLRARAKLRELRRLSNADF